MTSLKYEVLPAALAALAFAFAVTFLLSDQLYWVALIFFGVFLGTTIAIFRFHRWLIRLALLTLVGLWVFVVRNDINGLTVVATPAFLQTIVFFANNRR